MGRCALLCSGHKRKNKTLSTLLCFYLGIFAYQMTEISILASKFSLTAHIECTQSTIAALRTTVMESWWYFCSTRERAALYGLQLVYNIHQKRKTHAHRQTLQLGTTAISARRHTNTRNETRNKKFSWKKSERIYKWKKKKTFLSSSFCPSRYWKIEFSR